jgi:hypothetical protein
MDTDFLDWALADFSGYVAADELYDGPFCMLSAVDNRRYKRILYDVLDHDPTHEDIRADTVGQPLVGDERTSQVCCSALNMTEIVFVV